MAEYYKSAYSGVQIDKAVGKVLDGKYLTMTVLDLSAATVDSSASAFNGQSLTGDIGMTGDELYEAWLSGPVLVKYTDSAGGTVQTALVTAVQQTDGSAYVVFVSAMNAKHPSVPAAMKLTTHPENSTVIGLFYPVASPMPDWTAEEGDINYIYGKPNVVLSVNGVLPDENGNIQIEVSGTSGYVVGNPVTFTLSASSWNGSMYTLYAYGYGLGDYGVQLGLPSDSSSPNTQAVVAAALTINSTYEYTSSDDTSSSYVRLYIAAVEVPTEDLEIAVFGLNTL